MDHKIRPIMLSYNDVGCNGILTDRRAFQNCLTFKNSETRAIPDESFLLGDVSFLAYRFRIAFNVVKRPKG